MQVCSHVFASCAFNVKNTIILHNLFGATCLAGQQFQKRIRNNFGPPQPLPKGNMYWSIATPCGRSTAIDRNMKNMWIFCCTVHHTVRTVWCIPTNLLIFFYLFNFFFKTPPTLFFWSEFWSLKFFSRFAPKTEPPPWVWTPPGPEKSLWCRCICGSL